MPIDRFENVWPLLVLIVVLILPFLASIMILLFSVWFSLEPDYEAWPFKHVPHDLAHMTLQLDDLGFIVRGRWEDTGFSAGRALIILAEHPETCDMVNLLVFVNGKQRVQTTSFQTRFDDGAEVATSNAAAIIGLPVEAHVTSVWLPNLRDVEALYDAHRQLRAAIGEGKKCLPIGRDAESFLTSLTVRQRQHYIDCRYFYRVRDDDIMRPTIKGALLMSLRMFWAIKPFYRAWKGLATKKLLHRYAISLDRDAAPNHESARSGTAS